MSLLTSCFKKLYSLGQGIVGHMDIAVHGGFDAGVAQELLEDLGLHTPLDGTGGVCMAECVHTETLDPGLIAKLVQVGVVAAVLARHSGAIVNKNQSGVAKLNTPQSEAIIPTAYASTTVPIF